MSSKNFSKDISQLREQIIGEIDDAVTKNKGMISLVDAGQQVQYSSDTVLKLTDISNNDDGTLRFSGFLHESKDVSGEGDEPYTMMSDEIDSLTVEDL